MVIHSNGRMHLMQLVITFKEKNPDGSIILRAVPYSNRTITLKTPYFNPHIIHPITKIPPSSLCPN